MSYGFLGCNPEETWDDEALAPAVGTVGPVGDKEFVLVKAGAAIGQYDACVLRREGEAVGVTSAIADQSYPLGVPQVAIANGSFGWAQIKGAGRVNVEASCAADAPLSTTATAGRLDDADAAGRIGGMMLTAARDATAGDAPMWCFDPRLDILA